MISGYVNLHSWEYKLLTHLLSYVLQVFVIEQYAFDKLLYRDGNKTLPK